MHRCKLSCLCPFLIGMVPVYIDNNSDMHFTQNSEGWIEVLTNEDDNVLTLSFIFIEKILLKQLQFEGNAIF